MEKISSLAADSRRTEIILNPRRLEQKRYSLLSVYPIEGSDVGVKYVLALEDITAIRQSEEYIYQLTVRSRVIISLEAGNGYSWLES